LRALVIGGGGSGKTSILRKLAFDCCRRAVGDAQAPLPFFAQLNFFDVHTDVLNGLLNVLAREADRSTEELCRMWSDGSRRCLFLLDGLNEVRPEFSEDCRVAVQQLTERTQHSYLITTRPGEQATELQKQISSLKKVEILQLDINQIRTYLQRAGSGDLYDRMEDRLLSLVRNPFLLWAITQSYAGLSNDELPRTLGQLYKNLIDRQIFGVHGREETKPQGSRPTRYNYGLVKKPVMARLAVELCQHGATRWSEDTATLKAIRDHLHEICDANIGIRPLKAHDFMPEPFAKVLLDELVENGILHRLGATLEFMHESVRDYFAAVELSNWPVEKVLENVLALIWRQVEPGYGELEMDGTLVQAVIMSSGLRADVGSLLQRLIDHHPLLAAHCLAGASDIPPDLKEKLLERWLALLDCRLARYRWVGCQCLRAAAAKVNSTSVARRLLAVIRSDSEWKVRESAARAFAAIDDPQLTRELTAQVLSDIPENDFDDDLGEQFRHLQTDTLIVELLTAWGDPAQTDARKRRVQQLFARMRRSSVRGALQRLAEEHRNGKTGGDQISHLAQAALNAIDSWEYVGLPGPEELDDLRASYDSQFETGTCKWEQEMSAWPREDLLRSLKDSSEVKRAAATRLLGARKIEATAELLDVFAREHQFRVIDVLLETLRLLGDAEVLYTEWQTRMRDPRWPLLFSVGLEFAGDLASRGGELSERWTNEFRRRQIALHERSYAMRSKQGWTISPDPLGGRSFNDPVYWLRLSQRNVEVFDPGMRPRLVAVAEMIGPRSIPVLKEMLTEDDAFLESAVPETLGRIATPEAVALLSECLSRPNLRGDMGAVIKGLETTRSKLAVQPLIEVLCKACRARELCGEVGRVIGVLNGGPSLVQFAHKTGMHGDEHCRFATLSALYTCGHEGSAVEEAFLMGANDRIPTVRRAAVKGLARIKSPKAKEKLLNICIDDADKGVREEAVKGLARMKSPKAEEKLLHICMEDPDQGVREEAAEALRQFPGDAGVPKLVAALEKSEDETRIHAIEALTRIRDDAAIPALVKSLESDHTLTCIAAAKALNELGFEQVETLFQLLCRIARVEPDIMVRKKGAKALSEIPGGTDEFYKPIREGITGGRYDEVIRLIGSDTPFLPNDENLYWWRGFARRSLGRSQDALADLDQAVALTDCKAHVHRIRAEVLLDLSRFPEALAAAEKAAEIEPKEAENYFLVGWCAYLANELEKSISASRSALELNPKLATGEFNLGLALLASGRSPEDMDAYNRGSLLCAELDRETALESLDSASQDLDHLILERPQLTARAEGAKTRLRQARKASLHREPKSS